MEKLYQDYKDIAEFYIVYISEAHASDDSWPVPYAKEMGIKEHKSFGERCAVADKLVKDKKLTIPFLVDNMNNEAAEAYQAWPDRVFLIRKDGLLGVAAARGPWGFKPALDAASQWLAEYKKTGKEPAISEPKADSDDRERGFVDLNRDLMRAYEAEEYKKALGVAKKMHKRRPKHVDTRYNIACLYALLDDKDAAYEWIEKAVDAGYSNVDHIRNDADFKTIRKEKRFGELVERMRKGKTDSGKSERAGVKSAGAIVGEWEMKTDLRGQSIPATMVISVKDGHLVGTWKSQGREMEMEDVTWVGDTLSFKRSISDDVALKFEGRVKGEKIEGKYSGPFGELECNGKRAKAAQQAEDTDASTRGPAHDEDEPAKIKYRGLLGPESAKFKTQNGKTLLWASGKPGSAGAEWYDFTDSAIKPEQLQFGIGKDRIRSIDDPLFVSPDDPRLLKFIPASPYRLKEHPKTNDEIMVIGYARGDDVRAYPAALLDHHELVNDRVGGKPVTVGW